MKAWIAIIIVCLVSCRFPKDPEGTWERVQGQELRVGVSVNKPWIFALNENGRFSGVEAKIVEGFAKTLKAKVIWLPGSESDLMQKLKFQQIDLVIAGLTDDSLWKKQVGFTKPYHEEAKRKHVIAVPPGENRFLLEFEKYLSHHRDEISGWINQKDFL